MRPLHTALAAVVIAAAGAGCGSATAPLAVFDLVDDWTGTFQGAVVGFPLGVDIREQSGTRLAGTGRAFERSYTVEGRYEPPTIYLRWTSSVDTLAFVGEVLVPTFMSGTLVIEGAVGRDTDRVSLARQ
ncbi:MAG: hypothetical protein KJO11_01340 [Gemmatimonadetes bacterium]|nr:hypothetical protein [Gemmatimonadota bacterium]NNF37157.1 hypothetical protein [Gemmatimonadota bacterium]